MINKGASGVEAALPFSLVSNLTGLPKLAHSWVNAGDGTTPELKVRYSGTSSFVNATISRIIELDGGDYEYRMSAAETALAGKAYYYCVVPDHENQRRWEDVVGPSESLQLILGLLHQNARLDNTVYNGTGLMTAARLRVFASAAACAAAVDGNPDGTDGEIFRFTITGIDEGDGKLLSYRLVRAL